MRKIFTLTELDPILKDAQEEALQWIDEGKKLDEAWINTCAGFIARAIAYESEQDLFLAQRILRDLSATAFRAGGESLDILKVLIVMADAGNSIVKPRALGLKKYEPATRVLMALRDSSTMDILLTEELADMLSISQEAMSEECNLLASKGLVTRRMRGTIETWSITGSGREAIFRFSA